MWKSSLHNWKWAKWSCFSRPWQTKLKQRICHQLVFSQFSLLSSSSWKNKGSGKTCSQTIFKRLLLNLMVNGYFGALVVRVQRFPSRLWAERLRVQTQVIALFFKLDDFKSSFRGHLKSNYSKLLCSWLGGLQEQSWKLWVRILGPESLKQLEMLEPNEK